MIVENIRISSYFIGEKLIFLRLPHGMPLESVAVFAGVPLVASVLVLVVVLAACVCFKDKANRIQISSLRLSFPRSVSRDSQICCSNYQRHSSSILIENSTETTTDNAKPKVPTLQRKLPEIPNSDDQQNGSAIIDLQSLDTGSELYATVESTNKQILQNTDKQPEEPLTTPSRRTPLPLLVETVPELLKDSGTEANTTSSGDSDSGNQYALVHHRYDKVKKENPYAWVKGQTSEERDTDTDNYDEVPNKSNWKGNQYEPVPPVPDKHYDGGVKDVDDDVIAQPSTSSQLTAANAVTGRVSASEIPYLTSPVDSPMHQGVGEQQRLRSEPPVMPSNDLVYNTSQDSGNDQDIRYTSISVREPLANLRSNLPTEIAPTQESYYMVVSDDEIYQTYDEIREENRIPKSEPSSGTSAYAEPRISRELPPVPPPVESLRSLASGQSRQNSSPSDDSRHLSPSSSGMPSSPSQSDTSDLYSVVNKPKSNRTTIHVTNQQSIEDLYAKVLKNKHLSLRSDAIMNFPDGDENKLKIPSHPPTVPLPELPVNTSSNRDPNRIRPRSMIAYSQFPDGTTNENKSITSTSSARDVNYQDITTSAKGNLDPGYESIQDIMDKSNGSTVSSSESDGYERFGSNNANFQQDVYDPDYETLAEAMNHGSSSNGYDLVGPDYETVNPQVNNADPGYEEIGKKCAYDNNSDVEPGYEPIRSDPGYETIQFGNSNNGINNNNDNDRREKDYETVRSPYDDGDDEFSDPSYEKVSFGVDGDQAQRARESWDLSPRASEVFSDDAASLKSPMEDVVVVGSDGGGNVCDAADNESDKMKRINAEPQYAVVKKRKRKDNHEDEEKSKVNDD